jgi:hypothetical protein
MLIFWFAFFAGCATPDHWEVFEIRSENQTPETDAVLVNTPEKIQ